MNACKSQPEYPRARCRVAYVVAAVALGAWVVPVAGAAEASAAVRDAWRREIPAAIPPASADATSGSSEAGSWSVSCEELDGAGSAEAILVVLPAGRAATVHCIGEREGGKIERTNVELRGGPVVRVSVAFPSYRDGGRLAHANGGRGGQALLYWNGEKWETLWSVAKIRDRESRWFELDDLDDDGVAELLTYYRRDLDVFTNEDELSGAGGSDAALTSGMIDVESVLKLEGGKWKKSRDLLKSLR